MDSIQTPISTYSNDERKDALAAVQHEIWADDMRTLLSHSTIDSRCGDLIIPAQLAAYILDRVNKPFADLAPRDQDLTRSEVQRFAPLVGLS